MQMANMLCAQGKVLLAKRKTSEARDMYANAVHRDPDNARAWNGLGVADDMLGKRKEAEDAYKQSIDLLPTDPTAANNLAHTDIATGDPEAAIALLEPFEANPAATPTLRQNLAAARKAISNRPVPHQPYADLGASPTEGMAQAHLAEVRSLLGDESRNIDLAVVPDVKVSGGIPVFTIHATGKDPQEICDILNPQAFPCTVQGK
jgi:predicted Zn-dependent protease